ncbi:hypothetical protein [Chitinophaga arvensicola]|uniref:Uncharacterized protein n=1 Tax=Chitinophaga arvensicola TaxID=29529 RepID=A0A1I0S8D4_9BACT|nr:hypothetical protein [Chitinophaga arvensicola]SEW52066.1 hypothetical protein SAMN04488122_4669 [Chitinophaga arvensicola]
MHNPLALLSPELLVALQKHGFTIFVRQSYPRGRDHFDTDIKEIFLITHYDDLKAAEEHMAHIAADHRKHLYQISIPEDREKLMIAAAQPDGYKVYVALLKDKKWKGAAKLQPKLKTYLQQNTSWKVKDGAIAADLYLHYGELMLKLVNPSGEITLPLSDIEKH